MADRLVLFGNWLISEPSRLRIVLFTLTLLLILVSILLPNGVVFAGNAPGGG